MFKLVTAYDSQVEGPLVILSSAKKKKLTSQPRLRASATQAMLTF